MEKEKDISYYLHLLKIKKWHFIIPAVLISIIGFLVAMLLPSVYESSSTILIESQQIPQDFVRATVTGMADERIQSLTQQILSRAKLSEIIKEYNLYPEKRDYYTQEEILDKMREDIKVQTIGVDELQAKKSKSGKKSGPGGVTIAFTITYQGKKPNAVLKVATNLTSLYLERNLKERQEKAETTTKFLEAELKELDERIASLGQKITKFKEAHGGAIPEMRGFNLSQAERLENETKLLENQLRASQDKKVNLEGQLAAVNPDLPLAGGQTLDPKTRLYAAQVELATMMGKNSDTHPDVIKLKKEIAGLEKMVSAQGGQTSVRRQKLTQLKAELATKEGRLSLDHPEIKKLQREIAKLEKELEKPEPTVASPAKNPNNPAYIALVTQIEGANNEIRMYGKQLADFRQRLGMFRQRLEETTKTEQEYAALLRDYENAHKKHMEVMNKLLESRIGEGMEESQKAEKFTLVDPPILPEKPVFPPRLLILLGSLFLGLSGGIGTVLLADQMDHTVRDAEDIHWVSDMPVLGTISRIETPEYIRWLKRRRLIIAGSTCLSIVLFLVIVHFFFRDLWVFWAQLTRLWGKYT